MSPVRRRFLLLFALGFSVAGYLAYLLAANLLLSTPAGRWVVNRRPQSVRVEWRSAWTPFPGLVRVRGLSITGRTSRVRWSVEAERCRGWIGLPSLLGRRFRVRDLSGEGVRASAVLAAERPAVRRGAALHPWTIDLQGIELSGVREIDLGRLQILGGRGDGRARGALTLAVGGDFRLAPSTLRMPGARVLAGGTEIARDLDLAADARIAPYAPRRHPGIEGWDFVTGSLAARGRLAALVLDENAGSASARGDLKLDLRLASGRLAPGSLAAARWGPLSFALAVAPGPPAERLVVTGDGGGIAAGGGGRSPVFRAGSLRLRAESRELRVSRLLAAARRVQRSGELPAASPLTAAFHAANVDVGGPPGGEGPSWQAKIDQVEGRIDLPALLRREVALAGLRAEGIEARFARRAARTAAPAAPGWIVRVVDAKLTGVRELEAGDLRGLFPPAAGTTGLELGGGGELGADGRLSLAPTTLRVAAGQLFAGGQLLARDLAVDAALSLAAFPPREPPGLAALDLVSATVRARGNLAPLPALAAAGRPGPLAAEVTVIQGRLAPGSRITIGATAAAGGSPLALAAAVEPGERGAPATLRLSASSRGFVLPGAPGEPPALQCASLRLSTATPELRLSRLLASAEELRKTGGGIRANPGTEPAPLLADLAVEGLSVHGAGSRVAWQIGLESGSGRIDLAALPRRRLDLRQVRGEGGSLRLDHAAAPLPRRGPPWQLSLSEAKLGVRSLAFAEERLTGAGELAGDLTISAAGEVAVPGLRLAVPAGLLLSGGNAVAHDLNVRAEARVAPFAPSRVRGPELLRLLSATVAVAGRVSTLGFLEHYFRRAPWLRLEGEGWLDTEVRLDGGFLVPGSRLSVREAHVEAGFLDSVATGEAVVKGEVRPDRASLAVLFDRFALAAAGGDPSSRRSYVRGGGLRLEISSTDLDLATPVADLRATVDLPDGEVPDLTAYNAYLPAGTGVSILSGTGRLRLHLGLDAATQSGDGQVLLTSDALRVELQDLEIAGHLLLRAQLASRDLKARRFQIGGTRLDLDRVVYHELTAPGPPTVTPAGWWAHLELTDGAMRWGRPLALTSAARLEMKDPGLFFALFARHKNHLPWFERLLRIEGLIAQGTVHLGDGAIEIEPLRVTGGRLDLRSRLRFTRQHREGDLYVRYGNLATGIALRDGRRELKLIRPEEWFEKRQGFASEIPGGGSGAAPRPPTPATSSPPGS